MGSVSVVVMGALVAVAISVPPALLVRRALAGDGPVRMGAGLAAMGVSLVVGVLSILAVSLLDPPSTLAFGVCLVCVYLVVWAVESLRAWRALGRHPEKREG